MPDQAPLRPRPYLANPDDLTHLADSELVILRIRVETEMHRRHIPFHVGEVGEALAIEHFNKTPGLPTLRPAPSGTKNVDAISRDGERYSIKTLLKAKKTGTVYPDRDRVDRQLFEHLLIVLLDAEYTLKAIYRLPWDSFVEVRRWDRRMNAWYVSPTAEVLGRSELLTPQ